MMSLLLLICSVLVSFIFINSTTLLVNSADYVQHNSSPSNYYSKFVKSSDNYFAYDDEDKSSDEFAVDFAINSPIPPSGVVSVPLNNAPTCFPKVAQNIANIGNRISNGLKNTFTPARKVFSSIANRTPRVKLRNYNQITYAGQVQLGGQMINAVFDSGSSDMYVEHEHYTPHNLFGDSIKICRLAYVDGASAVGPTLTDELVIAGLKVQKVPFVYATEHQSNNPDPCINSLIGLGPSSLSECGHASIMDLLKQQGKIQLRAFGFYFHRYEKGSRLFIGKYPKNVAKNGMFTTKVVSPNEWAIHAQQVKLNNIDSGLTSPTSNLEILVDSGCSCNIIPRSLFAKFYRIVQLVDPTCNLDQTINVIECTSLTIPMNRIRLQKQFPSFNIQLNNQIVTISPIDYIDVGETSLCIQTIPSFPNRFIFGIVFMRKYFTWFNMEDKTISFAQQT